MRFSGAGNADLGEQIDGALARGLLRQIGMGPDGFDQLIADPVQRIEAGEGILENHSDTFSADPAHLLAAADRRSACPTDKSIAAGDAAGLIDQADHRQTGDGLSGAGFADHAQHLALGDVERYPVDGAQRRCGG